MSSADGKLDRRLNAIRPDLAASSLRGKVSSPAYADGERFTVLTEVSDLKRQPRPDAPLETQVLYGETVVVYDDEEGWGWAQSDRDGYVGYIAMSSLGRAVVQPTHRVVVKRTFVYPAADLKQPHYACVPLEGRVTSEGVRGDFVKIRGHGFVYAAHLASIDRVASDPVTIAEMLTGTPYLWGGNSPLGIDCSGLVQLAWSAAGMSMPRDTDMQESLGEVIPLDNDLTGLERGDLVFWKGHVGIMRDAITVLHANAHHMFVAQEPLSIARDRVLTATGLPISSIRRVSNV